MCVYIHSNAFHIILVNGDVCSIIQFNGGAKWKMILLIVVVNEGFF